jgi:phenylpyruvate tautomerase PptA (4-oxalocrotonate tautomerase family)
MPLYTVITEEHALSSETKTKMAGEMTRIHSTVMNVPANFVRVVFLSYPRGSGYAAGVEASTAAVNCVLRSGHSAAEKKDVLQQLWSLFQDLTGIASDQLAISLQEIPSSNAMEMGHTMPAVGQEQAL